MSVESLCTGSTVLKQAETVTVGATFGVNESFAAGTPLECRAEVVSAHEDRRYAARGIERFWRLFFSSDPAVDNDERMKLTAWDGVVVSHFLRVLACYTEGRPGTAILWLVDCEQETTRQES